MAGLFLLAGASSLYGSYAPYPDQDRQLLECRATAPQVWCGVGLVPPEVVGFIVGSFFCALGALCLATGRYCRSLERRGRHRTSLAFRIIVASIAVVLAICFAVADPTNETACASGNFPAPYKQCYTFHPPLS